MVFLYRYNVFYLYFTFIHYDLGPLSLIRRAGLWLACCNSFISLVNRAQSSLISHPGRADNQHDSH